MDDVVRVRREILGDAIEDDLASPAASAARSAFRLGWDAALAAERVLIARCENLREPDGQPCPGRLRYRWGQPEAACDTCGGRCGIAVAAWVEVQPGAEEALARMEALADELDTHAWQLRYTATGSYDDGRRRAQVDAADRIRGALDGEVSG